MAVLGKESINCDLVAVSCCPLCEVVTLSEWESESAPPPPPSFLRLAPRDEEGLWSGFSVAAGAGGPHVSEWRTLCAGASLFV